MSTLYLFFKLTKHMSPVAIIFLTLLGIFFMFLLGWILFTVGVGIVARDDDETNDLIPEQKCNCPDPDYCTKCK